jgi:hypothetical protein
MRERRDDGEVDDLGVLIVLPRRRRRLRRQESALPLRDGEELTAYVQTDGRWLADILDTWVERKPAEEPPRQQAIADYWG